MQQHAFVAREYGEQHGCKWLTTQMIQCPEDKAWQLVALACTHTLANAMVYAAIGIAAIYAARSSDRVRFLLGVTAFVAFVVYGLYDLGLFHA